MLPSPFYSEIPFGLGDDTAWFGRDVMQALQCLRRYQPTDIYSGAPNDTHIQPHSSATPTTAAVHPRDGHAKGATC